MYSEYSLPLDLETQALGEFPGGQIPFLYWIGEDGSCPLRLPLHYMELSNPQAKCLYYIDDVLTEPERTHPRLPLHGRTIRSVYRS